MIPLPESERILLGPGPSMVSPRVMRTMAAPVLSHLDPDLMAMMDELRGRLDAAFRAPAGSFSFAVSGTGTSAMETAVANLVGDGTRVLALVGGYFADRIAGMSERYGGAVTRLPYEWGTSGGPGGGPPRAEGDARRRGHGGARRDVHGRAEPGGRDRGPRATTTARSPSSTRSRRLAGIRSMPARGASARRTAARRSASGRRQASPPSPFRRPPWSGASRRAASTSTSTLLEDYWVRRKYHHTICASLLYALREALLMVEEEGLEARWARHRRHHLALAAGIGAMGLSLLPPEPERLWTLNAVRVPDGVDEAAVRKQLLQQFDIEVGAGLGPLAGKIWRVGLMGASSTPAIILLFLGAFESVLRAQGAAVPRGAGTAAALDVLGAR